MIGCSRARIEGGIESAICIEAGYSVAGCAVVGRKVFPDDDLAIGLQSSGIDITVCPIAKPKVDGAQLVGGHSNKE